MARSSLLALMVALVACRGATPEPTQGASSYPYACSRGYMRVETSYPGPSDGPAARADKPPLLLSAPLTLGGQPVVHMLPSEQLVMTPVPVYFEPPPSFVFKRAWLKFKAFGSARYKSVPFVSARRGLFAEIPCEEVTTTGPARYFISMVDERGEEVATLGSEAEPFRVQMKVFLDGGLPSIPGMKPPCPCADTADARPR